MTVAYSVTCEFYGTNAISGHVRQFKLGETLACDANQSSGDANVTLEIESAFFVVERSIFNTCCVHRNEGAPFF
jgi:hypothetical protein